MALTRKKYIVDKKFQYGISFKAMGLPLLSFLVISAILLYFADLNKSLINTNNEYIDKIIVNQDAMIDTFLGNPILQREGDPAIHQGQQSLIENIGSLKKIKEHSRSITRNSTIVLYVLIAMTVFQTLAIFVLFIRLSHRISGPIQVMSRHLDELRQGRLPVMRPLRKKDELQNFYKNFKETMTHIHDQQKKSR
jgi:nitrogen fixation/metabolism regulation signal transduction histidine kinase